MKNKILKGLTGLMLLSLVACGSGKRQAQDASKTLFPDVWESKDAEIEGGTLKVAVLNSTSFKGLFSPIYYDDAVDDYFMTYWNPPLFTMDGDFNVTDEGLASLSFDVDAKVATVKFKDNLKWDDGEPLTVDDYIYTYEVIANKDYTGVRFDDSILLIEGMEEYHQGKADKISGLEKVSDTELKIHLKEMTPYLQAGGGGIIPLLVPKHHLSQVPIKDQAASDQVRKNIVGAGEFRVKQIIPGESVELEPNPYYYKKDEMPKVEKVIIKIVPDTSAIASMKAGEYDVYKNVNENMYSEYKDFDNLAVLGRAELYYQYLGFNLGKWDKDKGENVTDTNSKMYDLNLRKAIAYALNVEDVAKLFYNGLRQRANSIIPPVFDKFYPKEKRYVYDVEKSKKILDEAGYKDVDGDGIREDKNGKPFEIKFAFPAMGDIAEPLSQQYIQDLETVGLKVVLTTGRIMEGNSFFDKVRANDKDIDMWIAAWGVASDFEVSSLYGRKAPFNFSRLTSEKNDQLLKNLESIEGLKNPEYRAKAVKEWEENYMNNELGFIPLTFRYGLQPNNKRVKYLAYSYDSGKSLGHKTALTAKETFKSTK